MANLIFINSDLERIFETGSTKGTKIKPLSESTIKKYIKTINYLRICITKADLATRGGLRYEKLSNSDIESVRIDDKWRLYISVTDDTIKIIEIKIMKITKHYGDNG